MSYRARTALFPKIALSVGLFFVGTFIARVVLDSSTLSNRLPTTRSEWSDERARLDQPPPDESLSRSLDVLLAALDDGGAQSLQLLRSDVLRGFEEYRSVALPALKERALDNVLSKLTEEELVHWFSERDRNRGKPLQVRSYIDGLWTVNSELGAFLESAVALIFSLHQNTKLGQPFDVQRGLSELEEGGVALPKGRSPTEVFSQTILFDSAFRTRFERERGEVVASFIRNNRDDLPKQLRLVFSLTPRYLSQSALEEVGSVLKLLATKASAPLREQVFEEERRTQILHQAALRLPPLRRLLAELYAVGAVDALENRDLARTKLNMHESLILQTGLPSQRAVLKFLDKLGLSTEKLLLVDKSEPLPPMRKAAMGLSARKFPWLSLLLGLFLSGGALLGALFIYRRYQESLIERQLSKNTPSVLESPHTNGAGGNFMEWKFDELPVEESWSESPEEKRAHQANK